MNGYFLYNNKKEIIKKFLFSCTLNIGSQSIDYQLQNSEFSLFKKEAMDMENLNLFDINYI